MSLLLGPAAICGVALYEEARPKSPRQLALRQAQQANKAAARFLARSKVPEAVTMRDESSLVLGAPVEGGLLDWIKQRWFCLPLEHLICHAVVIGTSGSGKSETLLRIAVAAAKALGWQVVLIDLKGDYKAMAKFVIAMEAAGIPVRLFPLEGYNGWVGTRDALLSRLLAIDNIAEVTSSGQHHYKTVRENLIEMAVNAPGGPPKNSQEFLNRLMLTNGLLYDLYTGYAEQQNYLEVLLERPQDALSAYGHYRAFFSKAHGKLDGNWSYDDCQAAYVLLDGLALPEITDGVGRFLLADFVNYSTRKRWDKRVLFIPGASRERRATAIATTSGRANHRRLDGCAARYVSSAICKATTEEYAERHKRQEWQTIVPCAEERSSTSVTWSSKSTNAGGETSTSRETACTAAISTSSSSGVSRGQR
jgi:Helicase HerA, central domain